MKYKALNFEEKFSRFSKHWSPRVIAQLNDYQFKLVKVQGEFVWHDHPETDEAFIVISGVLDIEFKDGKVTLESGEMFVIPKGVEHRPMGSLRVQRRHALQHKGGGQQMAEEPDLRARC